MARDLKAGEPLEADVVDLAHDGRGIARLDGKAVFIEGALPGERVRFRVTKRRRRLEEAVLLDILTASPDRVTPRCVHFGLCGGCSLQHLSPEGQLAAKQRQLLDNLERIGGVRPLRVIEALKGPAFAYRRRARLGVKYVHKKGRVLAGFRERDKPYLADLRRCEILLERFATLPEELATLVETLSIREHIPQVEVAAGDERAALVFRIMAPLSADDAAALERFGTRLGVQIHLQPGGLDTIRPLLADAPPLEYVVDEGRVTLEFGPSDFVQINRDMNLAMIDAAAKAPRAGAHRYGSGSVLRTGQFHVALEPTGRRRRRRGGRRGSGAKARGNALRNGIGNAEFFAENLFEPARLGPWAERAFDLVLLDPPRAGAVEIMERMAQWRPRRVVYISCHPGSLARDAGILAHGQGYRLIGAGVMDMFPHTTHVESIAVFEHGE